MGSSDWCRSGLLAIALAVANLALAAPVPVDPGATAEDETEPVLAPARADSQDANGSSWRRSRSLVDDRDPATEPNADSTNLERLFAEPEVLAELKAPVRAALAAARGPRPAASRNATTTPLAPLAGRPAPEVVVENTTQEAFSERTTRGIERPGWTGTLGGGISGVAQNPIERSPSDGRSGARILGGEIEDALPFETIHWLKANRDGVLATAIATVILLGTVSWVREWSAHPRRRHRIRRRIRLRRVRVRRRRRRGAHHRGHHSAHRGTSAQPAHRRPTGK